MLDEDLRSSGLLEQQLVMRREELETYTGQVKESLAMQHSCPWSEQLQRAFESRQDRDQKVFQIIVQG